MITEQIISNCIMSSYDISGVSMTVADTSGNVIAKAGSPEAVDASKITAFIESNEELVKDKDRTLIRICDDNDLLYVLITDEDTKDSVCTRLTGKELSNLIVAYRDKNDRNLFFQDLLLDNLLLVDIYNRAQKLHVDMEARRCVFVIEPVGKRNDDLIDIVRQLFFREEGDHVTAVDENRVVVIKALSDDEAEEDLEETAKMLVDMAGSEADSDVRVSYGTIKDDIKGISASYREARLSLDVAGIFYPFKKTIEYTHLGVGRLIYQLPVDLCRLFVKEIFGDDIPEEIDEEVLTTVNRFFENNLNVSETSRQLFIHRNTLMYRIEKLQKATGLDVRVFDDALTLKIALMVVNYMKYNEKKQ